MIKRVKMQCIILFVIAISLFTYWLVTDTRFENHFFDNEEAFQMAADAYNRGVAYSDSGSKRWLTTMPANEGHRYLQFHLGKEYASDYYKPRVVYVPSDNFREVPSCSFDGKLIKKLQFQWYLCQESRF